MKKNLFLPALLLSFLTAGYLHAESIVMKSTVSGLEALSDEDIKTHGQVVSEILLKYSWPMCQDSDLTPEEQHKLLSPEGNEERFLERKLNETIPASERDFEFAVVFVPTTLYELFCITEKDELYPEKAIHEANIKIFTENRTVKKLSPQLPYLPCIQAQEISTKSDPKMLIRRLQEFNQLFYPDHVLKSHQLFATFLSEAGYFSDSIKQPNLILILNLIDKTNVKKTKRFFYPPRSSEIILNYIECEKKAHATNKGLISRSSALIDNKILASTIRGYWGDHYSISFGIRGYWGDPYSISFGGSLFAGLLNDTGACVFDITNTTNENGYTIFIDKHKYYQNKIDNLFFIPALSTLSGVFAEGEFFHPRSKAAIQDSSMNKRDIKGIGGGLFSRPLADEAQVLTVERDALKHDLKFLKYFIDNFEIFAMPKNQTLTIEDQQAKILHAQCEAFVKAKEQHRNPLFEIMYLPQPVRPLTQGEQLATELLDFAKKTRLLIKERQEQLAQVLNAIAEVAQEQSVSTKLATAQEQARNRIQTISRHLSKVFSKL